MWQQYTFLPRVEDALEVTIPKGAKFPILLPPIDPHVKEDGELLGYVHVLKFTNYNLGDSKTYPQFRPDQYLTVQRNPRTALVDNMMSKSSDDVNQKIVVKDNMEMKTEMLFLVERMKIFTSH